MTTKASAVAVRDADIIDRLERIEDRITDMQRIIDLQLETIAAMRSEVHAASEGAMPEELREATQ